MVRREVNSMWSSSLGTHLWNWSFKKQDRSVSRNSAQMSFQLEELNLLQRRFEDCVRCWNSVFFQRPAWAVDWLSVGDLVFKYKARNLSETLAKYRNAVTILLSEFTRKSTTFLFPWWKGLKIRGAKRSRYWQLNDVWCVTSAEVKSFIHKHQLSRYLILC